VTLLLVIDQVTKGIARATLVEGQQVDVIPRILEFTLVYNTGVAFGLFENMGVWLAPIAFVVAVVAAVLYVKIESGERLYKIALILVGAGAIGNFIDRIFNSGKVTDFINIHVIHVFNVADMCITFAVALLMYKFVSDAKREAAIEKSG
jgi:signal peptidase II